jgi:thiol-disulfide isomerase/thioredoxin
MRILLFALFLAFFSLKMHAQLNSETLLKSKVVTQLGDTLLLADTLKAFENNIVLVDYWASWCGPCWREMPYSEKLKLALKTEKVVFLYLSTDLEHQQWKNALKKLNGDGIHFRLIPEFKPAIQSAYAIHGIPFYQILGKRMELLKNNANWPGSGKLEQEIRNNL